MDDRIELNNKLKCFLDKKKNDSEILIKRLTRKRKYIKVIYYLTTVLSIGISSVLGTLSATIELPKPVVSVLSIISAVLTGVSTRFNFKGKNHQINKEIENLNSLKNTIEYVISCNGNLTTEKFEAIINT